MESPLYFPSKNGVSEIRGGGGGGHLPGVLIIGESYNLGSRFGVPYDRRLPSVLDSRPTAVQSCHWPGCLGMRWIPWGLGGLGFRV